MGTELKLMRRHFSIVRASGYSFVPSVNQPKGQVMVCFDDGWKGIYDNKDFFIQEKVVPTIFIAVSLIGQEGYLTVEQIKELANSGYTILQATHQPDQAFLFADEVLALKDAGNKITTIVQLDDIEVYRSMFEELYTRQGT